VGIRVALALLRLVQPLAPAATRREWVREWEAEIRHRWEWLARRGETGWRTEIDLVRRSLGALADAAWLRQQYTIDLDSEPVTFVGAVSTEGFFEALGVEPFVAARRRAAGVPHRRDGGLLPGDARAAQTRTSLLGG
jgi:hypothetical protein